MNRRKSFIVCAGLLVLIAAAVILWPAVVGVKVDRVIPASFTATGEEEPGSTLSVTIRGRAYLKPFSGEIGRFHGLFRVERFGEEGPEEAWIEFNGGGNLPSSWIENGEFRSNRLASLDVDGLFEKMLIVVYDEEETGWTGDRGPFLSYPGLTRADMNAYLFRKMGVS